MAYADARTLLRKYGLKPKKSWGQNFLVEPRVFDGLVRESGAGPEDTVVEIGAGLGTLTARLALVAGLVIAVERDRDMAAILRAELAGNERVQIAEANALTFDYAAAGVGGRAPIVVGNLPYQIASPILFRLLACRQRLARVVVMLQLEMAQRIIAAAGTPEYGAMSVMVQMVADTRIAFRVPAGAFHPRPRVASAVLVLQPLAAARSPVSDDGWFSEVVHAGFGQRRKTLRNALRTVADPPSIERALAEAAIDPSARGETLDVAAFARLSEALLRARGGRQLNRSPPAA